MRDVGPPNRKTVRFSTCQLSEFSQLYTQRLIDLWIEWGWGLGYPLFMTVVICTFMIKFHCKMNINAVQILYARTLASSSFKVLAVHPVPPTLGSASWLSQYFHSFLLLFRSSFTVVRILWRSPLTVLTGLNSPDYSYSLRSKATHKRLPGNYRLNVACFLHADSGTRVSRHRHNSSDLNHKLGLLLRHLDGRKFSSSLCWMAG